MITNKTTDTVAPAVYGADMFKYISVLIRARHPILAIRSREEKRVTELLTSIAREKGKNHDSKDDRRKTVYEWTVSYGLVKTWWPGKTADDPPEVIDESKTRQPALALRYILEKFAPLPGDDLDKHSALFIMKDIHRFLHDSMTVRLLRDIANIFPTTRHQTLILVSPDFSSEQAMAQGASAGLPLDLQADVVEIDFPLPSPSELSSLLARFADDVRSGGGEVDLDESGYLQVMGALRGLTKVEAEALLGEATLYCEALLSPAIIPIIVGAKAKIIARVGGGALEFWAPESQRTYDDIGGLDLIITWCLRNANAYSAEAQEFGVEPARGLLFTGNPGTGKSLLAKVLAGGVRALLKLDFGALMGSLLGQSERTARDVLSIVDALGDDCIFWWDEIDKAATNLNGSGEQSGGTVDRVWATFLTWMQESESRALVYATANRAWRLPAELLNRFTAVFYADLPGPKALEAIFKVHIRRAGRDPDNFDLDALVKETVGFVGREVERAVKAGVSLAFESGAEDVTTAHILTVIEETVPMSYSMTEQIEEMREWADRARPASSEPYATITTTPTANRKIEFEG